MQFFYNLLIWVNLYSGAEVDTLPVRALYVQSIITLLYRTLNGHTASNIHFPLIQHAYNYRSQNHLQVPGFRLEYGRRRFAVQATQSWNDFVEEVGVPPKQQFKHALVTFLRGRVGDFLCWIWPRERSALRLYSLQVIHQYWKVNPCETNTISTTIS